MNQNIKKNENYYYNKANKYYLKYNQLKTMLGLHKQVGGSKPLWFRHFYSQLESISKLFTQDVVLTGSGALTMLLMYANRDDLLNKMTQPNDLDFVYVSVGTNYYSPNKIGEFNRLQPPQRSVQYIKNIQASQSNHNDTKLQDFEIKSFDMTQVPKISYIVINGINVITPTVLLSYYTNEDDPKLIDKNIQKISILNELIKFTEQLEIFNDVKTEDSKKKNERNRSILSNKLSFYSPPSKSKLSFHSPPSKNKLSFDSTPSKNKLSFDSPPSRQKLSDTLNDINNDETKDFY